MTKIVPESEKECRANFDLIGVFATETQSHNDTETQIQRDSETQRHKDTKTRRPPEHHQSTTRAPPERSQSAARAQPERARASGKMRNRWQGTESMGASGGRAGRGRGRRSKHIVGNVSKGYEW